MLKKIVRVFLWTVLTPVLLALFIMIVVNLVVRPANLKRWVRDSGIYSTAIDGFIAQSSKDQSQSDGSSGPSLSDPAIQAAAKKALTPQLLQASTENVIDGTVHWLDGKTTKPDFRVDLSGAKATFVSGVGEAAKARVLSLPNCPPRKFPSSTDPFIMTCRPTAGFNIDTEVAKYETTMQTSKDFLPDTVLTADNLLPKDDGTDGNKDSSKQSFFTNQKAPKIYQLIKKLPLILGTVVFVLVGLYLLLSIKRLDGLRMIGINLLIVAFVGGLLLVAGQRGLDKAHEAITQQHPQDAMISATKINIASLIDSVGADLNKFTLQTIAGYGSLGVVILGSAMYAQHRQNSKKKIDPKEAMESSLKR